VTCFESSNSLLSSYRGLSIEPNYSALSWILLFPLKNPAFCVTIISKQRNSLIKVSFSSFDSVVSAYNLDFLLFIRLHTNYWIVFAGVSISFLFIPINDFRYWPSEHQNGMSPSQRLSKRRTSRSDSRGINIWRRVTYMKQTIVCVCVCVCVCLLPILFWD
jgi:hypothetical protein